MTGLQYDSLFCTFNENLAVSGGLIGVNVGAPLSFGHVCTGSSSGAAVGDCFWWPGKHESLALIVNLTGGMADAVEFCKSQGCKLHPQGQGCWRPRFPIVSEKVVLPESLSKEMNVVPRRYEKETAYQSRCYRLVCQKNPAPARASMKIKEALLFLEEAASDLG